MSCATDPIVIECKHGDMLVLGCRALDVAGAPVPLTTVAITSKMRSLDGVKTPVTPVTLVVEPVDLAAGTFELYQPGDGRVTLPAGATYQVDIEYSAPTGGMVPRTMARSSRTFFVQVLSKVSRA